MFSKIDIYSDGRYVCSTNWSKTLKEAINRYKSAYPKDTGKITASYALPKQLRKRSR